jgi:hypothetical protein
MVGTKIMNRHVDSLSIAMCTYAPKQQQHLQTENPRLTLILSWPWFLSILRAQWCNKIFEGTVRQHMRKHMGYCFSLKQIVHMISMMYYKFHNDEPRLMCNSLLIFKKWWIDEIWSLALWIQYNLWILFWNDNCSRTVQRQNLNCFWFFSQQMRQSAFWISDMSAGNINLKLKTLQPAFKKRNCLSFPCVILLSAMYEKQYWYYCCDLYGLILIGNRNQ